MRVTENTNFNVVRDSIRRSKGRMEGLQTQAATLRKMNAPSDNPIGAAKVLEIRTDKVNNDQFQSNARLAEAFLNNSEQALAELSEIAARAKEVAIGQSSEASANDSSRLGIAEEITHLFQQAVATANRKIGDRYLFGGFKTDRPPVTEEGKYRGDEGQMMVEIAKDVFLAMNVSGTEAFKLNPKMNQRLPANDALQDMARDVVMEPNLFNELQNLRIALLTGDVEGVRSTLDTFDQVHGHLVAMRSKIGSRLQGLQTTNQALERHNLTNAQLGSNLEDADMAQVVSDLAKEETVFRSALESSKRLIQPTLMDFLR